MRLVEIREDHVVNARSGEHGAAADGMAIVRRNAIRQKSCAQWPTRSRGRHRPRPLASTLRRSVRLCRELRRTASRCSRADSHESALVLEPEQAGARARRPADAELARAGDREGLAVLVLAAQVLAFVAGRAGRAKSAARTSGRQKRTDRMTTSRGPNPRNRVLIQRALAAVIECISSAPRRPWAGLQLCGPHHRARERGRSPRYR